MANLSLAHSLIFRKLKQQKHHGLNFQFLDYFHLQGKFKFCHGLKLEMLFKLKWKEGTEDKFTYKVNESLKREELNFVRPKGKEVIIKLLAIIQTSKKKPQTRLH